MDCVWPETASPWQLTTPPDLCPYLPAQTASLHLRLLTELDANAYDQWLRRGWRRHGLRFFRPCCPICAACRSLRVDVARFRPSKSQRRIWRRNADIQVQVGPPTVTSVHVDLFNAYHEDMHRRRGWPANPIDAQDYWSSFLAGRFRFAREFRYLRGGQLVGVGLVDVTSRSSSSVYFYHQPAWRPHGPGTFSLLAELQYACEQGLRHHYLGYWIADCPSMSYKSRFQPHQLLQRFVDDDEQPTWVEPT